MEGKLFKVEDDYRLINSNNSIIGTTDLEYQQAFSDVCQKLSLKNCEAIFNGYDLDELAENHALEVYDKVEADEDYQDYANFNNRRNNFKEGFQKALEILGDKKFSEDSMKKACAIGIDIAIKEGENDFKPFEDLLESLQQTEWDVVVEMEEVYDGLDEMAQKQYSKQPKLDENGCLILKRK